MAKPDLGAKRLCPSCGTKYFDFNRDPVVCPKCGTVFEVVAVRASSSRAAAREEAETEEADPAVAETVSLDEVEASEKVEVAADDELEVEDGPADDTFLEEEDEENDDVSGLIDGDIDPDEEG